MYQLSLISYVLALGHFALELLVFRTASLGAGLISPLIVACELSRALHNDLKLRRGRLHSDELDLDDET